MSTVTQPTGQCGIKQSTNRDLRSLLISMVTHAGLICWLVWWSMPTGSDRAYVQITASIASVETVEFDLETSPQGELAQPQVESGEASELVSVQAWSGAAQSISISPLSSSQRTGGQSLKFFGSQAYGNRFVFVLDISSSMGARDGERIERAKYELIDSVSHLTSSQEFYVVLFGYHAVPMFGEKPARYVRAESSTISRLRHWIDGVKLQPGTDPRRALAIAGGMKPDAVFFLTDGDFNRPARAFDDSGWLTRTGKVDASSVDQGLARYYHDLPIHCIAFENPFTFATLARIGEQTGGTARYVKTQSFTPVDRQLFESTLQSISNRIQPGREYTTADQNYRLSSTKTLIAAGELVYADYIVRPLRGQDLINEKLRATADDVFDVLDRELTDEARKLTEQLIVELGPS